MSITDKPHIIHDSDTPDEHLVALPAKAKKQVTRGWEIQLEIEKLTKELKEIKANLHGDHGEGLVMVIPSICRVPISQKLTVKLNDIDLLKETVEEDIDIYAIEKTTFTPTKEYKEAILDEDHEKHDLLIDTSEVVASTVVKFLPSK